jgi:peptide/nickel transport system permease protein
MSSVPLRHFRRYWLAAVGGSLVVAWIVVAIAAPLLAPYGPDVVQIARRLQPPSGEHWFGTDTLGRDILSRVLYGAQISLLAGGVVVMIGGIFGTLVGGVAA